MRSAEPWTYEGKKYPGWHISKSRVSPCSEGEILSYCGWGCNTSRGGNVEVALSGDSSLSVAMAYIAVTVTST